MFNRKRISLQQSTFDIYIFTLLEKLVKTQNLYKNIKSSMINQFGLNVFLLAKTLKRTGRHYCFFSSQTHSASEFAHIKSTVS